MIETQARPEPQTVLIAGAGIAGLTLALALKQGLGAAIRVRVADPAWGRVRNSGRATAIAAGPQRMFETLGVWRDVAAGAQPILTMEITDSRQKDAVRPVYLRFDGEMAAGLAFAHMVEDDDLVAALARHCVAEGVEIAADKVERITSEAGSARAEMAGGAGIAAHLVVAADGGQSPLRRMMRIGTVGRDYPLTGIVATIGHERPHEGRADEHFLEDGPFALLPMTRNRCSIVWTTSKESARRLAGLPAADFLGELEELAGFHLGEIELLDGPRLFPLAMRLARSYIAPRFALAGDAAHVIHPLAGQGLNLGLRDVAALAEGICDHVRLGLDAGGAAMLEAYQRARRFDTLAMAAGMDAMDGLFRTDLLAVRMLRDLGLGLVNRMPGFKSMLMREAAALSGGAGRLFRGELP